MNRIAYFVRKNKKWFEQLTNLWLNDVNILYIKIDFTYSLYDKLKYRIN